MKVRVVGCNFYIMCGLTLGIACMTTILNVVVLKSQIIKNPLYSLKLKKQHILGKYLSRSKDDQVRIRFIFLFKGHIALSWITAILIVLPIGYFENFSPEGLQFHCSFDMFNGNVKIFLLVFAGSIGITLIPLLINFKMKSSDEKKIEKRSSSVNDLQKKDEVTCTLTTSYRSVPADLSLERGTKYDDIVSVDVLEKTNKQYRSFKHQRIALKKIFYIALFYIVSW